MHVGSAGDLLIILLVIETAAYSYLLTFALAIQKPSRQLSKRCLTRLAGELSL